MTGKRGEKDFPVQDRIEDRENSKEREWVVVTYY